MGRVISYRAVAGDAVSRAQERFFETLDATELPAEIAAQVRQAGLALASEASRESFVNGAVVWGAPVEKAEAFWRSAYALAALGSEPQPAPDLHPRTETILAYVRSFLAERGYAPTVREIGDGVGIASKSLVDFHLRKLADRGLIRRDPVVARGIVLVGGAA